MAITNPSQKCRINRADKSVIALLQTNALLQKNALQLQKLARSELTLREDILVELADFFKNC